MPEPDDGKPELLPDKNSALVPVDFQPVMFSGAAAGQDDHPERNVVFCKGRGYPERAGSTVDQPAAQPQFHQGCHKIVPRQGSVCPGRFCCG